ncbi:MAG TPA: pyruvate dehydrogenase, partial [Acidimicrobiia bacterium]|nr:pyruvate dehydrogenase [Acidimicrobiia bacterium]
MLGQLGLAHELFDEPLFPVGTLYDPFVCRGLDAFIYSLYSGSRFIVVATPSGVTLSPEGGAHQSMITPSIGTELPGVTFWEPCFAYETEVVLLEAFRNLAEEGEDGGSAYLRLSTKPIEQSLLTVPKDEGERQRMRSAIVSGAHRVVDRSQLAGYRPGRNVVTIAASGAMVPEAIQASQSLLEDDVFVNVVSVTSIDRLFREFTRSTHQSVDRLDTRATWSFGPWEHAPLVTVLDGHAHTHAWLGTALGVPTVALGVDGFGSSGMPEDLYRRFRIDAGTVAEACVSMIDVTAL